MVQFFFLFFENVVINILKQMLDQSYLGLQNLQRFQLFLSILALVNLI